MEKSIQTDTPISS